MFEGGSASTPVVDKKRNALYVLSHEGELRALSIDDGKELWKVSYVTALNGSRPNYGYSSSPLLYKDILITVPGGRAGSVAALDPGTGAKRWSAGKDSPGYSSPVLMNGEWGSAIMVFNSYGLSIFNAQRGQQLARTKWETDYNINASFPLYIGGHIFVCSGYGKGGGMFRFDGNELTLIYESKETVCQFQSPIESRGFAYMVIGDNSTRAKLACMRLDAGRILWTEPLAGNRGNVITADNISSGFAGAAFVIYLSGLTSIKFTATQYALFSSIMLFIPKLIAGYSGGWVDIMGYQNFFILTAAMGIPVLFLILWIAKVAPVRN